MSKYQPLWQFLSTKTEASIDMSFDQVETILGFAVDHSFLNYKKELEKYGYRVNKIYLKEKRMVFEKLP